MLSPVKEVQDGSFESEVIKTNNCVVVDFWAPWCGPCKAISPIVEELAKKFVNKIKFFKCNVDENPVIPGEYNIKAIPTLIFFKEGKVVDKITGMVSKSKMEETINNILST